MRVKVKMVDETVDVIIPVYNGERYIISALDSVVNQTHPPEKIIVVDDGSTDNTSNLVKSFEASIPIFYVKKANGGASSARNAGILLCSSKFIAFIDADDEWYPEKLENQLKVFSKGEFTNLGVIYCGYEIIDENGYPTDEHYVLKGDTTIRGQVFEKLLYGNMITGSGSSVFVKRECFERVGGFDESLINCEDWDMWLRIAESYCFDYSPLNLVKIRRHDQNIQNLRSLMFSSQILFFNKWCARLKTDHECFDDWGLSIAYQLLYHKSYKMLRDTYNLLSINYRKRLFRRSHGSILLCLVGLILVALVRLLKQFACYERGTS